MQALSTSKTPLLSLCLVNHFFLDLARPLLYRDIHLNPSLLRKKASSAYSKLVDTILFVPPHADFVRSVAIDLKLGSGDIDWIIFRSVLRQCRRLEKLSTGRVPWDGNDDEEVKLFDIIQKEAPSIKHLEVRNIDIPLPSTLLITRNLRQLELLAIYSLETSEQIRLKFKLRQVVWTSHLSHSALKISLIPSSSTILTHLSCNLDYEDPPMLGSFSNLSTLRLVLDTFNLTHWLNGIPSPLPAGTCVDALRATLLTTHSLTLKRLTICTIHSETAEILGDYSILEYLPTSIVTLSTIPQLLGILNLPSLLAIGNEVSTCTRLRRLTIVPALFTDSVPGREYEYIEKIGRRVSQMLGSKGVDIVVELGAKVGDCFDIGRVSPLGASSSSV